MWGSWTMIMKLKYRLQYFTIYSKQQHSYQIHSYCRGYESFLSCCYTVVKCFKYNIGAGQWTLVKKVRAAFSWETHLRATERQLPNRITQCYLPPDTSEHTPPWPQPVKAGTRFTYPRGMDGWVDLGGWLYIPRWFTRPQTVTHPSTNRARRRVTTSIETNAKPSHQPPTPRLHCY